MIVKNEKMCNSVTRRQARALPFLLSARTVGDGCQAAGISRKCFYNWMKEEAFRSEYRGRQSRLVDLAMVTLKGNAMEAAEKLSAMVATEEGPAPAPRMQGRHRPQFEDQGARRDRSQAGRARKKVCRGSVTGECLTEGPESTCGGCAIPRRE